MHNPLFRLWHRGIEKFTESGRVMRDRYRALCLDASVLFLHESAVGSKSACRLQAADSFPGMELLVDGLQAGLVDVGVNLRRADVAVTQ